MDILVLLFGTMLLCTVKVTVGKYNESYMTLEQTKILRGIFAMVILFDHIAQHTSDGILFKFFMYMGYLSVGIFFFLSGYGLTVSYIHKGEIYLSTFFKKRINKLIIPYFVVTVIYIIGRNAIYDNITIEYLMGIMKQGSLIVSYSWYVVSLFYYYLMFYFACKIAKKKYLLIVIIMLISMIIYVMSCQRLGWGEWWYNSCLCLLIGILWAIYETAIDKWIRDRWLVKTTVVFLMFLLLFLTSLGKILPLYVPKYCVELLCSVCFVYMILMIIQKCKLESYLFTFLGDISYEIYMLQGLMIMFFSDYKKIRMDVVFAGVVIASTFICAYLLHILNEKIFKRLIN